MTLSYRACLQVWRYKDSIAASLREKEISLTSGDPDSRAPIPNDDWDDRGEMLVHVGGLVEADAGTAVNSTYEGEGGGSVERASTPPTAENRGRGEVITSSPSSGSVSSMGSLPSAVADEAATTTPRSTSPDSSSTPPLPPPSESAAQQPPARTASEAARSKTLVPRTEYLPVPTESSTGSVLRGRVRSEREAKEAVKEAGGGIVLDPDREIMLKFLVGKTGDRHGKLPVMVRRTSLFFLLFLQGDPFFSFPFARNKLLLG